MKHIANFRKENTMQDFLLYRPYGNFKYVALFPFLCGILMFGIAVMNYTSPKLCIPLTLSVFEFFSFFYIYNLNSIAIVFGQSEVQVFDSKVRREYLWTDFSDIYYGRNGRGCLFIVMSSEVLTEKQVKSFCRKCSWSNPLRVKNALVFPVGNNQDEEKINQEIVKQQLILHKEFY